MTEEVYALLKDGYVFQCRGIVKVKGKGDMTTYFLLRKKQEGECTPVDPMASKNEIQENSINSKAASGVNISKHATCSSEGNSSAENMNVLRGKKSLAYPSAPVSEILATSSPRLPSMQLPPWQPKRLQTSLSTDSQTSLYSQPKPIIGNAPSKSYSQSRPRYSQGSINSSEETTKNSSSLPELKDDLQDKLQKMNTNVSLYTSKVYRPSKMYTHPRTHSINKSPTVLTPPEEAFNFPAQNSLHNADSVSTALASDMSAEASSSHDSLLEHDRNNSMDTSSLTRSSPSSCDSYMRTDYSRTDVDSPSPALYDYNASMQWIYPENMKNVSLPLETTHQNFSHNILSDGKQLLPEVGLSPSRNLMRPNSYNMQDSIRNTTDINNGEKNITTESQDQNTDACPAFKRDLQMLSEMKGNKLRKSNASQQTDASALMKYPQKVCARIPVDNLHSPLGSEQKDSSDSDSRNASCSQEHLKKYDSSTSETISPTRSGSKPHVVHLINPQKSHGGLDFSQSIPLQALTQIEPGEYSNGTKRNKPFLPSKESENNNSEDNVFEENSISKQQMGKSDLYSNSSLKKEKFSSHNSPDKYSKFINNECEEDSEHPVKSHLHYKFSNECNRYFPSTNKENILEEGSGLKDSGSTSGQLSDSDESDDEKSAEAPLIDEYCTDDPTLENASLLNEHGLTDAEGALSDLNSIINDPGPVDNDMDDTSISSRASSRMFDSDQLLSVDSLNVMYDSEYDNYRPGMVSDDDIFQHDHASDADLDYLEDPHMENIRVLSNNITKNFGQPSRGENDESELG